MPADGDGAHLVDGHGRPINSIRISVNRECNLDCFYCHNEGMAPDRRTMTLDEVEELARMAADLGVRKVKLTGGEPLEREDVVEIVRRISPLFEDVSMTTNATRLADLAGELREAGLDRVNVSLHSVEPSTYRRISGKDLLATAMEGVDAALAAGLRPVKLNMVLLRGINDDQFPQMLAYAASKGAVLQVIELEMERERVSSRIYEEHHASLGDLRDWLRSEGRSNGRNPLHNRERYVVDHMPDGSPLSSLAEVELVMPMHNTGFCANCTRIRLTAGGYVKGCLFDRDCVEDLVSPLRAGAGRGELQELLGRVVAGRRPYWTDDPAEKGPEED